MSTASPRVVPSLLRQMNERSVLAALQAQGPLSRADLCRRTGASGPTITRVVASLIEARLIEEIDEAEPRQRLGRPGKIVRLARTGVCVLGCVIGAKQTELVVATLDGDVDPQSVRTFATPTKYEDVVAECVRTVRDLMRRRKATVLGMGLSVPGLLNRREGRSIVSPNAHQFDGRNLGHDLRERLQTDVVVLQECHALCRAEQTYGAARGVADFAMLDISEGLGLGVMHGGRILEGHSGLAGELGHLTVELNGRACGCGNVGCLETVATDSALVAVMTERLGRAIEIDEIVAEVRAGRLDCRRELDRVLDYLAVGVAAVINIFNPSKVFIYGRFLDAQPELFAQLLERTRPRTLAPSWADCEVVRAQGSKRLGAVAAAVFGATHGWDAN
jgi:predicted NBD/HSP70 family sugar kinase